MYSMNPQPQLSIIIPTYNEKENLRILIERISHVLRNIAYEIIVVDDNSPDETWALALQLAREYPIRVIRRLGKRGLASAIVDGFKYSVAENIIVMDADLQHPPEIIPRILKALQQADIVVASRYAKGGGIQGWTIKRKIISIGAKLLAFFFLPQSRKTSDPMSGFFGIKKHVIKHAKLDPIGYKILLEILVKGHYNKIIDVPYIFVSRKFGESKMRTKEMSNYVKHLMRLVRFSNQTWKVIIILTIYILLVFSAIILLLAYF